jgi:hypothetical protein
MTRILPLLTVVVVFLSIVAPADAEPWYCRIFPWLQQCRPPPVQHYVPRVTNLSAKVNPGVPSR